MGEVYQARDTKLDRDVALKVLPEAFTADPDRLARFEREAKVLASLNHPNIGTIYGLEEAEGGKFKALVLELVEGPTLADRIAQGPIPVDEALSIAGQIAEALEAAHEQGVIHRDLKPANIKVREDGTVKVLDFGLAKALDPAPTSDASQSPTLTAAATQMGVIMGTAAYMSPEQARGKSVDRRTDIWAFGCVLYEMLSGQRAFGGSSVSDTVASILRSEPDWTALRVETPIRARQVMGACLQKTSRERMQDAGDIRLALGGFFDTAVGTVVATPPGGLPWRRTVPWLAALSLLVVGVLAAWSIGLRAPVSAPRLHFVVPPPAGRTLNVAAASGDIAMSPDGGAVVYLTGGGGTGAEQLHLRRLGDVDAVTLVDDGLPLVYAREGGLWAVRFDLDDLQMVGDPVPLQPDVLVKGSGAGSFALSATGTLAYLTGATPRPERPLLWVDRHGAEERLPITGPFATVALSPDGGRAATHTTLDAGNGDVWLYELASGRETRLTSDATSDTHPVWSPDGRRVVFTTQRAAGFELVWKAADNTGPAESIATFDDAPGGVVAVWDWSRDGDTLFLSVQPRRDDDSDIGVVTLADGRWEPLIDSVAHEAQPTVSPDGRCLSYSSDETGRWEVYVQRFPSGRDRSTLSVGGGRAPRWSSDGTEIFYQRAPTGTGDALMAASVSGLERDAGPAQIGTPEVLFLFDGRYQSFGGIGSSYAADEAGQRFLMIGQSVAEASRDVHVVVNWQQELLDRVPVN